MSRGRECVLRPKLFDFFGSSLFGVFGFGSKVGDTGPDECVVPIKEFLDVGGVYALAIVFGEYFAEVFTYFGVSAQGFNIYRF